MAIKEQETKANRLAYTREWRKQNKQHVSDYNKTYHSANLEKMHAKSKRWRSENKEQMTHNNVSWNKAHPEERRKAGKKWRAAHPRYRPNYMLKCNYNITLDDYERIAAAQGNVCIVCKKPQEQGRVKRLHVDHDHKHCPGRKSCGKCIRGLTCRRCNLVLGEVKDDIKLLKAMINYLRSKKRVK